MTTTLPDILDDATRRQFLTGAAAAVLLAGSDRAAPAASPGDGFPVTVEHKYGSTVIAAEPARVVTVESSDEDYVIALGVAPAAITRHYLAQYQPLLPWTRAALGANPAPELLDATDGINFEQVAATEPDLIIGTLGGLDQKAYDTLTQIAPTVAQSARFPDYGTPWQEATRSIGRALGRTRQAQERIAALEARFAQVREAHPEFAGASAIFTGLYDSGNVYPTHYDRSQLLDLLGFVTPPAIAELLGRDLVVELSRERLDLLEADLLVWLLYGTARDDIAHDPLYRRLEVARQGRDVFLPDSDPVSVALDLGTVLSVPVLLDGLVPRLVAAIDGAPTTEVPS